MDACYQAHEPSLETAHDLYKHLAHDSSLKGLLKPFKGKGDYEELVELVRSAQNKLQVIMKHLVTLTEHQQIAHRRMTLRLHKSASGQYYLRWRTFGNTANTASGDELWKQVVSDPLTAPVTKRNLLVLEKQRIALNLQAACVQSMLKQALQGRTKVVAAESLVVELLQNRDSRSKPFAVSHTCIGQPNL